MVDFDHEKETSQCHHYSTRTDRSRSHCPYQGTVWLSFRQCRYQACLAHGGTRGGTLTHHAPKRNEPYIPVTEVRGFTARSDNVSVEWAEALGCGTGRVGGLSEPVSKCTCESNRSK